MLDITIEIREGGDPKNDAVVLKAIAGALEGVPYLATVEKPKANAYPVDAIAGGKAKPNVLPAEKPKPKPEPEPEPESTPEEALDVPETDEQAEAGTDASDAPAATLEEAMAKAQALVADGKSSVIRAALDKVRGKGARISELEGEQIAAFIAELG